MSENGIEVATGIVPTPKIGPGEAGPLSIDFGTTPHDPEREYLVTLSARTNVATELVSLDHEVAWDQFEVQAATPRTSCSPDLPLSLGRSDEFWTVTGRGFSIRFSRRTGEIDLFRFHGRDLMLAGPQPNFWRPPTDNDLGNGMHEWAAVWQAAGPGRRLLSTSAVAESGNLVTVTSAYDLPSVSAKLTMRYEVNGGDTSWGRLVHPEYTIPAEDQHFGYWLIPFNSLEIDPNEVAGHYGLVAP